MTSKKESQTLWKKELESKLQEIDLDTLWAALENLQKQDEQMQEAEAEQAALEIEAGAGHEEEIEILEEVGALKKSDDSNVFL